MKMAVKKISLLGGSEINAKPTAAIAAKTASISDAVIISIIILSKFQI